MRLPSSRRPLVAVAALPVLLAGLLALPGPQASAAPAPTATSATVSVTGAAIPAGSAAGYALVADDTDFRVTVDLLLGATATAVSSNKDTTFALSLSGGANSFNGVATVVVKAGQTSGSSLVQLADPSKSSSVGATVTAGSKDAFALVVTPTPAFDVLSDLVVGAANHLSLNKGAPSSTGSICTATADSPLCADLYLPSSSTAALSFGPCDGFSVCGPGTELQALFGLVADPANPVTLVYRCDKVLCGGGGVSSFPLFVSLTANGTLLQAPQCTTKGVQTSPGGFCFDAKQSNRDNAGDTNLYLLLTKDARVTFP
jgi:hypothetical protein